MLHPTVALACFPLVFTFTLAATTASLSTGIQGGLDASLTGKTSSDFVATTWYAGWHGTDFPLADVSWSKYSSVIYAFGTTTPDVSIISLEDSNKELLPKFVEMAHKNNVNAMLSIGGWTGSQYFSIAMATPANRTAFVEAVSSLVLKYDLDGIDFDWEYPNIQGVGCNTISKNDSANFLSFLQELRRSSACRSLTLSAAVTLHPFADADGNPMSDVSAFAEVLDYIEIMDYDVWGSWSASVGPNAPLDDTCALSVDQRGSAVSAVKAWTSAKFPVNKIVLGVASYGHSFRVNQSSAEVSDALVAYPPFDASLQPSGDKWDDPAGIDKCGNPIGVGGIFDFWGLIDGGFLDTDGKVAKGILYRYDNCSQTPYVYNPSTQVMVSYDDATSFAAKGHFIKDTGLKGFAMWEAGGDYADILLDAISKASCI